MSARHFILLLTLATTTSCHFKNKQADLILHNATIYAVDDAFSTFEALAIKDGKILALGTEREILNEYDAPQIIDCGKQFIYPGFIDGHCHFLGYGRTLQEVNLDSTASFTEVIERVKAFKPTNSRGWIIGRGWDQNDWTDQSFPSRAALDSLFPSTPIALQRIDGHAMLVNAEAMRLADIDATTKVSGGDIDFTKGILIDNAMNLITAVYPQYSREDDIAALLAAQERCFAAGLTTVDDAGLMKSDVDLIKQLQAENKLKMRLYVMLADDSINYAHYLKSGIDTSDRLSVRAFKFYADGALGSRGACLLAPYDDVLPYSYGLMLREPLHFRKKAYDLRQAGFQMCTHAIGDSANRVMLDIYGEVVGDSADHRWRIEHAQVVHQNDLDKFAQYHVIPSVQPTHATSDMPWAPQRLGRSRVMRAYSYRELKEQNGMVALGTDFPVEGISPINTFYAAIARKDLKGQPAEGFQRENALTREDALRGMTIWAALANFEEHKKGTLEVGKLADIVVLNRDIMRCSEQQLPSTEVIMTILQGEVVFKK
ncbi:MAG: amidohydrolase [Flavobacteriales bacterium]|jgi:predicted amidohydrolase YtcJ